VQATEKGEKLWRKESKEDEQNGVKERLLHKGSKKVSDHKNTKSDVSGLAKPASAFGESAGQL
jgi:hypothetical protein